MLRTMLARVPLVVALLLVLGVLPTKADASAAATQESRSSYRK